MIGVYSFIKNTLQIDFILYGKIIKIIIYILNLSYVGCLQIKILSIHQYFNV